MLSQNISDYILNNFGSDHYNKYLEYLEGCEYVYIRVSEKQDSRSLIKHLSAYGIKVKKFEHFPFSYEVIEGFEKIGKTLEYATGKYYIQSLSSMLPARVLNIKKNDLVLDMCAAPGSKTTQLSELMNNQGTLYANEPNKTRIKSLVHNLDRMNVLNTGVIQSWGEVISKYFNDYFNKILVDAPCSGLGILKKKNEVNKWWSPKYVKRLTNIQLRLLISAIKSAEIGGEIVYSTCTLTIEENELLINTLLKKYPVELCSIDLPVKSHPAINKYGGEKLNPQITRARRIVPWEINSEGFFIAKLIKLEKTEPMIKIEKSGKEVKLLSAKNKMINKHLQRVSNEFGIPLEILSDYKYILKGSDIHFIHQLWQSDKPGLFNRIGMKFGTIDRRDICNLRSLSAQALSNFITKNIVQIEKLPELNTYLNGGTIKNYKNLTGQKIIMYNNMIIGTAVAGKEGLKSQFPRAMRTQNIIFPN
ncbi:NOL1/NOP2/sun family putative RNA methylase [Bacteroidota bacterium]